MRKTEQALNKDNESLTNLSHTAGSAGKTGDSKAAYETIGKESLKSKKHDTLIIIPAYNEEKNLQGVLDSLMKNNVSDYADILIINDASVDETPAIAKRNNVRCISFVYNLGYGNALQAGYKYAKDYLYDYVIQMDADGQHDVSNVYNIYKELCLSSDHPDIVLSCRFMDESKHYEAGFFKKIAHVWLRFLMKLCSGIYFPDSTTGLQGLSRNAFSHYAEFNNFDARYPDANMILKMHFLGFKIKQIPSVMHPRTSGKSMHSGIIRPIKYMIRITASVIAIWFRMRLMKRKG